MKTIAYTEKSKGWTDFKQWEPDAMTRLNNRFFSFKNGELYLHNDNDNPVRNNFYGEQLKSKIVTVLNESEIDDKIFKTLVLEGNKSWKATLVTNYTNSSIEKSEFNKRESRFFAYIRGTEDEDDTYGLSVQGIGIIESINTNVIGFSNIPDSINIGDELYEIDGDNKTLIGVIENYSYQNKTITLVSVINTPIIGNLTFSKKNNRVEGSEIRGYYMLVELENDDTDKVELFAVSSNAIKSYI